MPPYFPGGDPDKDKIPLPRIQERRTLGGLSLSTRQRYLSQVGAQRRADIGSLFSSYFETAMSRTVGRGATLAEIRASTPSLLGSLPRPPAHIPGSLASGPRTPDPQGGGGARGGAPGAYRPADTRPAGWATNVNPNTGLTDQQWERSWNPNAGIERAWAPSPVNPETGMTDLQWERAWGAPGWRAPPYVSVTGGSGYGLGGDGTGGGGFGGFGFGGGGSGGKRSWRYGAVMWRI